LPVADANPVDLGFLCACDSGALMPYERRPDAVPVEGSRSDGQGNDDGARVHGEGENG
jgi:hypothetical protein